MVRKFVRRTRRRKGYRKYKRSGGFLRKVVGKMLRKQQEKKYHTLTRSEYQVGNSSAPLIDCLTAIPQGDTDQNRDGDKLMLKKLLLEYMWSASTSSAYPYYSRVMVVQWLEHSSASTPQLSTLLLSTGTTAQAIVSPYNHDWRYSFRVLYDRTHTISNGIASVGSAAGTDHKIVKKQIFITPKKRWLQFSSGGVDSKNHIYLITYNYTQGGYTDYPYLSYCAKVNFTDS